MIYKLAEALYEAGWPQTKEDGAQYVGPDEAIRTVERLNPDDRYVPSLQALIEACRSRFWAVVRVEDEVEGVQWEARGIEAGALIARHRAKTPLEAMMLLYLYLHSKYLESPRKGKII